jgi:hypothetical protein
MYQNDAILRVKLVWSLYIAEIMNTEQQHKEMNPLVRTVTAELTNDG